MRSVKNQLIKEFIFKSIKRPIIIKKRKIYQYNLITALLNISSNSSLSKKKMPGLILYIIQDKQVIKIVPPKIT